MSPLCFYFFKYSVFNYHEKPFILSTAFIHWTIQLNKRRISIKTFTLNPSCVPNLIGVCRVRGEIESLYIHVYYIYRLIPISEMLIIFSFTGGRRHSTSNDACQLTYIVYDVKHQYLQKQRFDFHCLFVFPAVLANFAQIYRKPVSSYVFTTRLGVLYCGLSIVSSTDLQLISSKKLYYLMIFQTCVCI